MRRINVNPIFKKEIKLGARTIKLPIAVLLYAGFLSFISIMVLNMLVMEYDNNFYSGGVNYAQLNGCFFALVFVQLAMICMIVPILTASSIAGERERQTLDLLLTAPVTPFSIVLGKLGAAMSHVLLFVVSSLPALGMMFLYGGFQWYTLLYFLFGITVMSFFIGAVGIWCSSLFKRSITSVIVSLVIEAGFYLIPFMIIFIRFFSYIFGVSSTGNTFNVRMGLWPVVMLIDPLAGFVDLMTEACYDHGVMSDLFETFLGGNFAGSRVVNILGPFWGWISMGFTLLLGVFFLWLAARQIDAVRISGKRRTK